MMNLKPQIEKNDYVDWEDMQNFSESFKQLAPGINMKRKLLLHAKADGESYNEGVRERDNFLLILIRNTRTKHYEGNIEYLSF